VKPCRTYLLCTLSVFNLQEYWKGAHTIKGAALNLALGALADASKHAEMVGKSIDKAKQSGLTEIQCPLEVGPVQSVAKLEQQQEPLLRSIQKEYDRLRKYVEQRQQDLGV